MKNVQLSVLQKEHVLPAKMINTIDNGPAVSIIMPFNPKMGGKHKLEMKLKSAVEKIEKTLQAHYPKLLAEEVLEKLKTTISQLDFSTYKISIGIFVSPVINKVFYVDIPVNEKVSVDEAFEIRDLIRNKQTKQELLVLSVTEQDACLFKSDGKKLTRLVFNNIQHVAACHPNELLAASGMQDDDHINEIAVRKFLKHVDDGLRHILNAYHLPLIVVTSEKIKGFLKHYSKNIHCIVDFVEGYYLAPSADQVKQAIGASTENWEHFIEKWLLLQVKEAKVHNNLVTGIKDVWKAASQRKGRFLIVEKEFFSPAYAEEEDALQFYEPLPEQSLYIKDAVDVAIEKVLEEGGDIAFVEKGTLRNFGHIVLIQF